MTGLFSFLAGAVAALLLNPVLPGFHPDPSVVAVGEDYYLVNSSFHYFPGVPIYHSRDLQNWEQIGNVLDRPSQLPLKGATSWLGIYAPTIRFHDGTFYMITTNVGNGGNFMVTATDPAGPWSEPIWLEQQGIDPSLYFEDGRCYMVSNPDGVIMLCEIDPVTGKTLRPSRPLWKGTGGRYPEGPHIYKHDGWYYLLISEGGTELAHRLTVARSRSIDGPYESNPANPIFTHCSAAGQDSPIQGTGHADFFEAADGSWWTAFLAYRRFGGDFHHLGRETFLAPVTWAGGWPVINDGNPVSEQMQVALPAVPQARTPRTHIYTFDGLQAGACPSQALGPEWMHIQEPVAANYVFRDGKLELRGTGQGLGAGSWNPTALLRRQEAADAVFSTRVTVKSGEGGLALYQINSGYVTFSLRRRGGRTEAVLAYQVRSLSHEQAVVPVKGNAAVLSVQATGEHYRFLLDGRELARLETPLLSTEVVGGFTGVTVGMYCASGTALFDSFDYTETY